MRKLLLTLLGAMTIGLGSPAFSQTNPFAGLLTQSQTATTADTGTTTYDSSTGTTTTVTQITIDQLTGILMVPYGIPKLNGHAAITSPIEGSVDSAQINGQSLSYVIASLTAQNATNKWVPLSMIGAASGVAALDDNAHITNTGLNIYSTYTRDDGSVVNVPTLVLGQSALSTQYPTLGAETQAFGGFLSATTSNGQSVAYPSYSSLSLVGRPYGPYNAGCVLCVFSGGGTYGDKAQANISGVDYRTGAAAVAQMDGEQATLYQKDENTEARVVAPVTSFTASTAVLTTPLTQDQVSLLHPGMYVATNVISPTAPATTSTGLISENTYWGIIKSATPTTITVYGWAVLGQGDSTVGQIPNARYLDTTKSSYGSPVLFIGAPAFITSKKTEVNFDGSKVYSATATSRANSYQSDELNFYAKNFGKEDSIAFQGPTITFRCDACDVNAINRVSHGYSVDAPGLPVAFLAKVYGTGVEFEGQSTWLPGAGAPSSTVGSNHILFDFISDLPTGDEKHFGAKVFHDTTGQNSPDNYTIRLGSTLGGTRTGDVYSGGTPYGDVGFGVNGNSSSVCLETSSQKPTLCSDDTGNVSVTNLLSVKTISLQNYHIGSVAYDQTKDLTTGSGIIESFNDVGNGEADMYTIRPTSSSSGGYRWVQATSGASLKSAPVLMSVDSNALTAYEAFNQIGLSKTSTATNNLYSSVGVSTSILGRTGGTAVGNYSTTLSTQESEGSWTGALLTLNGFSGKKVWRFSDDGSIVFPDGTAFDGHIPDVSSSKFVTVATGQTITAGKIICSTSNCTDLQSGTPRDLKIEGAGLGVTGGTYTDTLWARDGISITGRSDVVAPNGGAYTQWGDQYHRESGSGYFSATGSNITFNNVGDVHSFLTYSDTTSSDKYSYRFQFFTQSGMTTPLMIEKDKIIVDAQLIFTANGSLALTSFGADTIKPATSDHIETAAPIIPPKYTYATLPTTYPQWGQVVCTDCISYLTASNHKVKGIYVMFNQSIWVDLLGNPIKKDSTLP